jgi:hypothetical protein
MFCYLQLKLLLRGGEFTNGTKNRTAYHVVVLMIIETILESQNESDF